VKHPHLFLIATASMAVLTTPAGAAQTSGPNAEVMATVSAALKAAASGDIPRLRDQYAPDVAFTDEFAPFFWSGPGAIDGYFISGGRMYQETQHRDGKTTINPPAYVYVSGDRAFVVEAVSATATVRGKPYRQNGSFAFVLARTAGRWKIISQTWTKTDETMNPY
jgi:ketosteroid isomerase-like protein